MKRTRAIGFMILLCAGASLAAGPYLIVGQHSTDSRTQFIVPRIQYLESLPFDGMSINTPESWSAMKPGYVVDSARPAATIRKSRVPNLRD